jgi:tRNA (guanine26-N2/guanine27-N2)-dimethyltransferase
MNDMRKQKRKFEVVDLDPYGTAIPFLEGAIQSLANNGLLCVTFTDMAVLCARKPHVCFYKYGAAPLGKSYCHEMALRMVLYTINTMANKHGKQIEPLLSLTVDFYVRLFIRVKESASECHKSVSRYSHVFQCVNCESHYLQRMGFIIPAEQKKARDAKRQRKFASKTQEEIDQQDSVKQKQEAKEGPPKIVNARSEVPERCRTCGGSLQLGGPIWNDKIHKTEFVERLYARVKDKSCKLKTAGRIKGVLGGVLDEKALEDLPLSIDIANVCSHLKVENPPKIDMIAAFK